MKTVTIQGARYKVVEDLGFAHSKGMYAVAVMTPSGERIAVSHFKRSGWNWSKPEIIVSPNRYVGQDK